MQVAAWIISPFVRHSLTNFRGSLDQDMHGYIFYEDLIDRLMPRMTPSASLSTTTSRGRKMNSWSRNDEYRPPQSERPMTADISNAQERYILRGRAETEQAKRGRVVGGASRPGVWEACPPSGSSRDTRSRPSTWNTDENGIRHRLDSARTSKTAWPLATGTQDNNSGQMGTYIDHGKAREDRRD